MSSKLIPSDPAAVMVTRNVTPNIVTFSVPFSRFGVAEIGGRGTLVKLTSGALAIFSPVALTEETKAKVAELGGQVNYIIALDFEHHIFISDWAKEYPAAKIIGPKGLPEKRAKANDEKIGNEEFAVVFTPENKSTIRVDEAFDADFEYEFVDGHANLELVFLYKPDRTLIQADLIFNLPANEQYSKVPAEQRHSTSIGNRISNSMHNIGGDVKWLRRFNWHLVSRQNRESFNASMRRINEWDFDTVIPCHGDVMQGTGKKDFQKIMEWHLAGKS